MILAMWIKKTAGSKDVCCMHAVLPSGTISLVLSIGVQTSQLAERCCKCEECCYI